MYLFLVEKKYYQSNRKKRIMTRTITQSTQRLYLQRYAYSLKFLQANLQNISLSRTPNKINTPLTCCSIITCPKIEYKTLKFLLLILCVLLQAMKPW